MEPEPIPTDYERLVRFIRAPVRRFGLAIARSQDRTVLEDMLQEARLAAERAGVQLATLQVSTKDDLLAQMATAAKGSTPKKSADILFMTGLDALLVDELGNPYVHPAIEQWNRVRDRLPYKVPARTILWLSNSATESLARGARDLFDVVLTTFTFDMPVTPPMAPPRPIPSPETAPRDRESLLREATLLREALGNLPIDSEGFAESELRLAEIAFDTGRIKDAEDYYQKALSTFDSLGSRLGQANTQLALGDLCMRTGRLPDAETYYRKALSTFDSLGSRLGQANTQLALGDLFERTDRLPDAEAYYRKALSSFESIGSRMDLANTQKALGDLSVRTESLSHHKKPS